MTRSSMVARFGSLLCVVVGAALACAQDTTTTAPAGQPAATPTTQPASTQPVDGTPITATVIELKGDVKWAPLDSETFTPAKVGDQFPPQTVIMTGLRSSALLRIGDDDTYTAVVIDPASKTLLADLAVTPEQKRVRIGVGYGQVRAGVVEGGLKSDFTVSSPVATLSKRGTWGFGLYMQRPDTFQIFLLDEGLVDAFNNVTGGKRTVLPGELVDSTMKRWALLASKLSNIAMVDILGQSDIDVAFNTLQQDGLRVVNPEGGNTVLLNLSNPTAANRFADRARQAIETPSLLPGRGDLERDRPEGFFGTGRGEQLIPVVIPIGSELTQLGVKAGTYRFPRPVIEQWLANRK